EEDFRNSLDDNGKRYWAGLIKSDPAIAAALALNQWVHEHEELPLGDTPKEKEIFAAVWRYNPIRVRGRDLYQAWLSPESKAAIQNADRLETDLVYINRTVEEWPNPIRHWRQIPGLLSKALAPTFRYYANTFYDDDKEEKFMAGLSPGALLLYKK